MPRIPSAVRTATALTALACALLPATALAHQGNPNYESYVRAVTPAAPGVKVQILYRDDRVQVTNHSSKPVTIDGYNGEPYAQILPNGTVEVNRNSQALYLNQTRYLSDAVTPPANAHDGAPVQWDVTDRTGVFQWHDHRIHYSLKSRPAIVKDPKVRTKVFDWKIPIAVGGTAGAIRGQLFWTPHASGVPAAAIAGFVVLLLASVAVVVVVRRRRAAGDDDAGPDDAGLQSRPPSAVEAW